MNYRPAATCTPCDRTWSIPVHGPDCPNCGQIPEGVTT